MAEAHRSSAVRYFVPRRAGSGVLSLGSRSNGPTQARHSRKQPDQTAVSHHQHHLSSLIATN